MQYTAFYYCSINKASKCLGVWESVPNFVQDPKNGTVSLF